MAEKEDAANISEEEKGAVASARSKPKKSSKGPLIMALLNTLAILAAAGTFVYTQILFKRPPITEKGERKRITQAVAIHPNPHASPAQIKIKPFTANVRFSPLPPGTKPTHLIRGKPHFITLGMVLILRDATQLEEFNKIQPKFMDKMLQLLGNKTYQELNSVQGRYLLRSHFVDLANKLMKKPLIQTVWFTDFVVQ